jgi:hypothetical protein
MRVKRKWKQWCALPFLSWFQGKIKEKVAVVMAWRCVYGNALSPAAWVRVLYDFYRRNGEVLGLMA